MVPALLMLKTVELEKELIVELPIVTAVVLTRTLAPTDTSVVSAALTPTKDVVLIIDEFAMVLIVELPMNSRSVNSATFDPAVTLAVAPRDATKMTELFISVPPTLNIVELTVEKIVE